MKSVLLLPFLLATALAPDSFSLAWQPKEGAANKYSLKMELDIYGGLGEYTATVTETISAVKPDRVTRTLTQSNYKMSLFGDEAEVADGDLPKYEQDLSLSGEIVEVRGDLTDASVYRLAALWAVRRPSGPVKTGESWTAEGKGDEAKGLAPFSATYKVEAKENDRVKASFDYKETKGASPSSSKGFVWFLTDGTVAKIEAEWTNATIPGLGQPVKGKVWYELVP